MEKSSITFIDSKKLHSKDNCKIAKKELKKKINHKTSTNTTHRRSKQNYQKNRQLTKNCEETSNKDDKQSEPELPTKVSRIRNNGSKATFQHHQSKHRSSIISDDHHKSSNKNYNLIKKGTGIKDLKKEHEEALNILLDLENKQNQTVINQFGLRERDFNSDLSLNKNIIDRRNVLDGLFSKHSNNVSKETFSTLESQKVKKMQKEKENDIDIASNIECLNNKDNCNNNSKGLSEENTNHSSPLPCDELVTVTISSPSESYRECNENFDRDNFVDNANDNDEIKDGNYYSSEEENQELNSDSNIDIDEETIIDYEYESSEEDYDDDDEEDAGLS